MGEGGMGTGGIGSGEGDGACDGMSMFMVVCFIRLKFFHLGPKAFFGACADYGVVIAGSVRPRTHSVSAKVEKQMPAHAAGQPLLRWGGPARVRHCHGAQRSAASTPPRGHTAGV